MQTNERGPGCPGLLGSSFQDLQNVPNLKFSLARATKKSLSLLPKSGARTFTGAPPAGVNVPTTPSKSLLSSSKPSHSPSTPKVTADEPNQFTGSAHSTPPPATQPVVLSV